MTAYADFLGDPQRFDVWIAELCPYDSSTAAEVTLRVATDEYATEPTDTPANMPYEARLLEGPSFETDAAPPGTLGQLPARRGGVLKIGQRFGDRDTWRSYDWDGRRVTVRHGGFSPKLRRKLTYAEMGVAEYEMESAKFGLDFITVPLRDPARRFEEPLQTRRYMGTDFTLRVGPSGATNVTFGAVGGAAAKANLTGDFTLEARGWINSFGTSETSVLGWNFGGATTYPFQCYIMTNGKMRLMASNYSAVVESSQVLVTKRWYHLQWVRSGTAIIFRVLEEAAEIETITTGTASAATGATANGDLKIGSSADAILDELRLWNYARTEDEWRDARGRELSATEAADSRLKLYIPFNSSTGTSVTDSSASPATGTVTGSDFAWLPSLQGKADLVGKVLPDLIGFAEDANPVLVYAPTQIYQLSSGQSYGSFTVSTAVAEGGAYISFNAHKPDWLAFLTSTTPAATYEDAVTRDGTFIRLGSKPQKPISVTYYGEYDIATGTPAYTTAADIVEHLLTTRGKDPLSVADLDATAYAALNTANSAPLGFYVTEEVTIAEMVRRALASVGAVGWFGRADRKHRVKRFEGAAGTPVFTFTEQHIISIEPLDVDPPVWEEILAYRHNFSPMSIDQMAAGIISTERQAFLSQSVRTLPRTDGAVKRRHKYARTDQLETWLTTEADALAENLRRLALFGQKPQAYRMETSLVGLPIDRMDIVAIDLKDLDSSGAGQSRLYAEFIVLASGERSPEGKATLTVWRENHV